MSSDTPTIPGVFIIESLTFQNEDKKLFEGKLLSNILQLNNVKNRYYYLRTITEFKSVLELFQQSNYRYLHISCHGSDGKIELTLDAITFHDLGEILKNVLDNKRLFLSACSSVNKFSAVYVIPKSKCYSLIGPSNDIEFRDAAILWASFYHLMFKQNATMMLRENLIKNLQKVVNTFEQPINYYSKSKSKKIKFKKIIVQQIKTTISEATQLE